MGKMNLGLEVLDICGIDSFKSSASRKGFDYLLSCAKNEDADPSCRLNEKGFWKCFSCGRHGNVTDFVMARLGISRSAALDLLKKDTIAIDDVLKLLDPVAKREKPDKKKREYKILNRWYRPILLTYEGGSRILKALDYMKNCRGISEEIMIQFDVRFGSRGRFRNRIVLPLRDHEMCVGITARSIGGQKPKYLHSTGAPISSILYGIDQWRLGKYNEVILVEGPFDVLKLHSAGIASGVAILGSEVSGAQVEALHSLSGVNKVLVGFDCDRAGFKAHGKFCKEYGDEFDDIRRWLFWKANIDINDIGDMSRKEVGRVYKEKYFLGSGGKLMDQVFKLLE